MKEHELKSISAKKFLFILIHTLKKYMFHNHQSHSCCVKMNESKNVNKRNIQLKIKSRKSQYLSAFHTSRIEYLLCSLNFISISQGYLSNLIGHLSIYFFSFYFLLFRFGDYFKGSTKRKKRRISEYWIIWPNCWWVEYKVVNIQSINIFSCAPRYDETNLNGKHKENKQK